MGWRYRKRINLGKGLRINLSKSGLSLGLGPRGANINIGRRGTRTNFGLPGTGLYHQTTNPWKHAADQDEETDIPLPSAPAASKFGTALLAVVIAAAVFGVLWLLNVP